MMAGSKNWLSTLCGLAVLAGMAISAMAEYPERPIHVIVGGPPGGGTDLGARVIAAKLSEKFGQPFVVEDKGGASGSIASDAVAHAKPDGYTLGFVASGHTITPSLLKLNYDAVKSFAPVRQVVFAPDVIVVGASSPVKTLGELLAMAKAKPGMVTFGDGGKGVAPYLEMVLLEKITGTNFSDVSFKSGAEAAISIVGGEIQTGFAAIGSVLGLMKSGKLRPLAVSTTQRVPMLPDVPTIAEVLGIPKFDAENSDWLGLLAPVNTPQDIVDKLNKAIADIIALPETRDKYIEMGFVPAPANSPAQFTQIIASDIARWGPMVKEESAK